MSEPVRGDVVDLLFRALASFDLEALRSFKTVPGGVRSSELDAADDLMAASLDGSRTYERHRSKVMRYVASHAQPGATIVDVLARLNGSALA